MVPGSKRTHPLTGVVQGVIYAGGAVVAFLSSQIGDEPGGVPLWLSIPGSVVGGLLVGIAVGFWIWWRTTYVIDAQEIRVDTGLIWRQSRRVPFERIQSVDIAEPLLARLVGLAELRIESAGGSDSRTSLRFLPLGECQTLRAFLLGRAHGSEPEEIRGPAEVITVVPPGRLILGTVLTLEFAGAVIGSLVLLTIGGFVGMVAFFGGIVPMVSWLVQIVGTRVIAQWKFRLTRTPTGLQIERGLLSRTSQTIPFSRVQGIAVHEPIIWRRLGWQRLEIDVAGTSTSSGNEKDSGPTSSTLLPIADAALAAAVIDELIASVDPSTIVRHRPSPRAWIFAPIGWRFRWVGADAVAFVARTGWVTATTSIVPHARTQSVAFSQGPLQRWRGVATVQVHSPDGPVNADGPHLPAREAREIAYAQLARARAAR